MRPHIGVMFERHQGLGPGHDDAPALRGGNQPGHRTRRSTPKSDSTRSVPWGTTAMPGRPAECSMWVFSGMRVRYVRLGVYTGLAARPGQIYAFSSPDPPYRVSVPSRATGRAGLYVSRRSTTTPLASTGSGHNGTTVSSPVM